jgi:BirA family biotin operon repressor/biotin-[acetyl-CoA-carboxylase] ligase
LPSVSLRKEKAKLEEFYFSELIDCFAVYYSPQCRSTGALLKKLLPVYSSTGPMVLHTYHQTEGKGQGLNTWESEAGKNLAFTLALDITNQPGLMIPYNKAIALGVCNAIKELSNTETKIKWPNDIYTAHAKICGMLMESHKESGKTYLIAGIGININQNAWKGDFSATSLTLETEKPWELILVLRHVLKEICSSVHLARTNPEVSELAFQNAIWLLGQWLWLEKEDGTEVEACILGVDGDGRLIFEDKEQNISKMHHGQVKISKKNPIFLKG